MGRSPCGVEAVPRVAGAGGATCKRKAITSAATVISAGISSSFTRDQIIKKEKGQTMMALVDRTEGWSDPKTFEEIEIFRNPQTNVYSGVIKANNTLRSVCLNVGPLEMVQWLKTLDSDTAGRCLNKLALMDQMIWNVQG